MIESKKKGRAMQVFFIDDTVPKERKKPKTYELYGTLDQHAESIAASEAQSAAE